MSALFWDLLDHRGDGSSSTQSDDDGWSYQDPITPFKIFLAPPKENGEPAVWSSMLELREAFKRNLNQADKQRIDDIYRMNFMAIP